MKATPISINEPLLTMGLAILALAAAALVRGAAAGEGKAVFADDFEAPSAQSPPANWAMWGAQQDKVPANYTRDATQRHGGQACFRIHHPAGTRGYVVFITLSKS